MSKYRLSELQKWILSNCYHDDNGRIYTTMKKVDIFRYWKNTFTLGSQTFLIKDKFKGFFSESEYNAICATITRSLWNLYDKGYIKLIGHGRAGYTINFDALTSEMGDLSQDEYVKKKLSEGCVDSKFVSVNTPGGVISIPSDWAIKQEDYPIELTKGCGHNICFVTLTNEGITKAKSLMLSPSKSPNLTLRNKGVIA